MAAAQAGDAAAYRRLLTAVLGPLRRAARARWPRAEPADIEDAVQETLLALHSSRHLYDPARPFLPFLLGILRFRGTDAMRRRWREAGRTTNIDDVDETSAALATNTDESLALDAQRARAMLKDLPEGQRRAIELLKLGEMSLHEAARETGMTEGALKVATHRALRALRRRMMGDGA
ncbi:MAG: sigma-70 family RNA polymerase sigma factor [Rhodospirillales bacterium]|nr:sigma-70 family RNA polymerase sigma factor [Rhodospirillales bacterium]